MLAAKKNALISDNFFYIFQYIEPKPFRISKGFYFYKNKLRKRLKYAIFAENIKQHTKF